jgi:hypothetical protein
MERTRRFGVAVERNLTAALQIRLSLHVFTEHWERQIIGERCVTLSLPIDVGRSAYRPRRAINVKSNGMDAPALYGISCAKVEVSSNHFNQQERPR